MPIRYRRISGADLATGIKSARVTVEQFAALYGVPPKRVEKWLTEEAEIPHSVALFVGLIADPLVLEKALVITQYMVDRSAAASEPGTERERGARRDHADKGKNARMDAKGGDNANERRAERIKARRSGAPPQSGAEDPETASASQKR